MDKRRWNNLEELLLAALELPADQRVPFLAEQCPDAKMRAEVESLLRHEHTEPGLLDQPARLPEDGADGGKAESTVKVGRPHPRPDAPPTQIGPYRIVRTLGEGGMGAVYLAEQSEPIRRQVAIKLIKFGMNTREVLARFDAERQALALMNHAHIARVLEAGATDTGRPYFVMEYAPGVPITVHCNGHRLDIRDRLKLFVQACEAIHHAHGKGVIHRDIKPSNILVTHPDGEGAPAAPKVIDFGVAKAIEQRLTEQTIFTEQGRIIGTPEYMSPEQASLSGEDIDVRTDVYSLGILLYELLVGRLPFPREEFRQAGYAEILEIIRDREPPTPSARLQEEELAFRRRVAWFRRTHMDLLLRELRGDLDWITMRALEKDPGRRYDSASELAEDVQRFLRYEPIEARPPSAPYLIGKYWHKHRRGVVEACFASVLAVVVVVLWWLFLRASVETDGLRQEASRERESRENIERSLDEVRRSSQRQTERYEEATARLRERVNSLDEELGRSETARREEARAREARTDALRDPLGRGELEQIRALSASLVGFATPTAELESHLDRARELADRWNEQSSHHSQELQRDGQEEIARLDLAISRARGRLEDRARVRHVTLESDEARRAWDQARSAIRDSPHYGGLELAPQSGLFPIGTFNGLWQFWHVASGARPQRSRGDPFGHPYRLEPETGVVLVLLPGGDSRMGGPRLPLGASMEHVGQKLVIREVPPGSMADSMGLEAGDTLLTVGGDRPRDPDELREFLRGLTTGVSIDLSVRSKEGKTRTLKESLGSRSLYAARDSERPTHRVTLSPFFLSRFELTHTQWIRLARSAPDDCPHARASGLSPVEQVSWREARGVLGSSGLRLPTEAQWEYAARAGTITRWWTGDVWSAVARSEVVTNARPVLAPAPVGSRRPNAFGLFDMLGNVSEWCEDPYGAYSLPASPGDGARQTLDTGVKLHRGGRFDRSPGDAGCATRTPAGPDHRSCGLGIRAARAIED